MSCLQRCEAKGPGLRPLRVPSHRRVFVLPRWKRMALQATTPWLTTGQGCSPTANALIPTGKHSKKNLTTAMSR